MCGVMKIEIEALLKRNYQWDVQWFETWSEFQDYVPQQSVGVYLVLCLNELERKVMELKQWRKFLYQLSQNGINFVFVKCDADGDCDSPKVMLLPIWTHRGHKNWNSIFYKGPMRPSDILQWITETLSAWVFRANSTTDVFSELYDSFPTVVVAHYTRPFPLSYAVLASELRNRVSFFWVETLDLYLPDRATLIVLSSGRNVTYNKDRFLNQNEIRWLMKLIVMELDDFFELVATFLSLVAIAVPLVAAGSIWQKFKAMFWFVLLCSLATVLLLEWLHHCENSANKAIQFLITLLAKLINRFQSELLLLFHLYALSPFAGYSLMKLVFLFYALVVSLTAGINRFVPSKTSDIPKGKSMKTVASMTSTGSVSKTKVEVLSRATNAIVEMSLNVNKMIGKFVYSTTKAAIRVPFGFAKTMAKIARNITEKTIKLLPDVAKTTTQVPLDVPSDVVITTGSAQGQNGHETEGPPVANGWAIAVTQSQSLKSQYSAPRPVPIKHDPADFSRPTDRPTRLFQCPPLVDLSNGDLDKSSMQQVNRLKNPKIWIFPVVSHKELKQLALALQKLEARDQRSFEPTSRTVPRCFYCGTDFEPTSQVIVLPSRDIIHPGCFNEWVIG